MKKGTSKGRQTGPSWHIGNVLTNLDFFGKDLPTFNIKGEGRVNTTFGGCISSSILMLTLAYTLMKFSDLYTKNNPVVSEIIIQDYYSQTDELDLNDINFKFAWSVENYYEEKRKNDSRFVKTLVTLEKKVNGVRTTRILPFHDCSNSDFDSFYSVNEKSRGPLQNIQNDKDRGFYCLDNGPDLTVSGDSPGDFQVIEIQFLPCNVIFEDSYGFKSLVSSECIGDLAAQQAYLGAINILLYFNNQRFDQRSFGQNAIVNESKIINMQSSNDAPTWLDFIIQAEVLNDET